MQAFSFLVPTAKIFFYKSGNGYKLSITVLISVLQRIKTEIELHFVPVSFKYREKFYDISVSVTVYIHLYPSKAF